MVGLGNTDMVAEAKDVACGDAVDAFRGRQAVDLVLEDMAQTRLLVGIGTAQALAVVETAHYLRDILSRLHIQVGEGLCRVVEASGILLFQHVHHALHHLLWREDLVGLLGRNIVEDVLRHPRVEIVGQPMAQRHELAHGVIEDHLVEEVAGAVHCRSRRGIKEVTTVAQQMELFLGHAGHLKKHAVGDVLVEVLQCGLLIAVAHEK